MDSLMSVPSTEIASMMKIMKSKGQNAADVVSDAITAHVLKTIRNYYEGIDADFDMQEEARLAGYESHNDFIEESDNYRDLVMELAGAFEEGFSRAWFHQVGMA